MSRLPDGYQIELGGSIEEAAKANGALVPILPRHAARDPAHPRDPDPVPGRHDDGHPHCAPRSYWHGANAAAVPPAVRVQRDPRSDRPRRHHHAQHPHPDRTDPRQRAGWPRTIRSRRRGDRAACTTCRAHGGGRRAGLRRADQLGVLGIHGPSCWSAARWWAPCSSSSSCRRSIRSGSAWGTRPGTTEDLHPPGSARSPGRRRWTHDPPTTRHPCNRRRSNVTTAAAEVRDDPHEEASHSFRLQLAMPWRQPAQGPRDGMARRSSRMAADFRPACADGMRGWTGLQAADRRPLPVPQRRCRARPQPGACTTARYLVDGVRRPHPRAVDPARPEREPRPRRVIRPRAAGARGGTWSGRAVAADRRCHRTGGGSA